MLNLSNSDIELIAAGAVISDHKWLDRWRIKPTDFEDPICKACVEIVSENHRNGQTITGRMVENSFPDPDAMADDEHTLRQFIREMIIIGNREVTPSVGEIIREQSARRAVSDIGEDIRKRSSAGVSPETVLAGIQSDLEAIVDRAELEDESPELAKVAASIVNDISDGVVPETIPCGSVELTRRLGGYERGDLVILAGRPSMGKSMVAQSLALNIAGKGHGVMMFSLEMSEKQLGYRALSDLSWTGTNRVEYQDIRNHNMNSNQIEMVGQAAAKLFRMPFSICDRAGLTIEDIEFEVRKQKARLQRHKKTLDLVIVDHMGHVKPSNRYAGSKTNEVGEISAGLLKMAKDLNVTVLALCQLNRGPENREEKRPSLADLRNSGDIEQDAHSVMFVYRDAYYLERKSDADEYERRQAQNKIEILIAKNRNGPTNTVELYCDPACNVIRDLAK